MCGPHLDPVEYARITETILSARCPTLHRCRQLQCRAMSQASWRQRSSAAPCHTAAGTAILRFPVGLCLIVSSAGSRLGHLLTLRRAGVLGRIRSSGGPAAWWDHIKAGVAADTPGYRRLSHVDGWPQRQGKA